MLGIFCWKQSRIVEIMVYLGRGRGEEKKNSSEPTFPFQDAIRVSFHFDTGAVLYPMKSDNRESESVHTLTIQRNINGSLLLYTGADMT